MGIASDVHTGLVSHIMWSLHWSHETWCFGFTHCTYSWLRLILVWRGIGKIFICYNVVLFNKLLTLSSLSTFFRSNSRSFLPRVPNLKAYTTHICFVSFREPAEGLVVVVFPKARGITSPADFNLFLQRHNFFGVWDDYSESCIVEEDATKRLCIREWYLQATDNADDSNQGIPVDDDVVTWLLKFFRTLLVVQMMKNTWLWLWCLYCSCWRAYNPINFHQTVQILWLWYRMLPHFCMCVCMCVLGKLYVYV